MPLNILINCEDFILFFILFFVCAVEVTGRKTPTYLLVLWTETFCIIQIRGQGSEVSTAGEVTIMIDKNYFPSWNRKWPSGLGVPRNSEVILLMHVCVDNFFPNHEQQIETSSNR